MKKIITVCFLFFMRNCFAQQITFQKTYGGINNERGICAKQTADGGYIITGWAESFGSGNLDIYLIKTNANGDTLWTKTFGGIDYENSSSVEQTADGGYIIAGGKFNNPFTGYHNIYLIKTDSNGNSLWVKKFGGSSSHDSGYSVHQTTDGGYIIAGSTQTFGNDSIEAYLIKTDFNGDVLWLKTFGGINYDAAGSVQQTTDGGYIIAGTTASFGAGYYDIYLIKTNVNGDTLWTKTFGGTNYDASASVQQTTDGGYIIAGYTESFGAGYIDTYLIKTNANGDTLWTKTFGGANYESAFSVQQTTDDGYVIVGSTTSFGAGSYDVYLIKTNDIGDTLWTKTYGGSGIEDGYSVQQTFDGGFIITGFTTSFGAGSYDVYLIKTDNLGNSGCNEGSAATIVSNPATLITNTATIVISAGSNVTSPILITGSGATITTLCTTVGIPPISNFQSSIFNIFPNPATNNFSIIFPNTINKGVIEIYNILGEKVFTENIVNVSQKEIRLNTINSGIYFVKVRDGESEYSEKLVIE
jgi:hypothetical protein